MSLWTVRQRSATPVLLSRPRRALSSSSSRAHRFTTATTITVPYSVIRRCHSTLFHYSSTAFGSRSTTTTTAAAAACYSTAATTSAVSYSFPTTTTTTTAATMRFLCRTVPPTVPLFFLTAAAVLSFRPLSTTQADSAATHGSQQPPDSKHQNTNNCPYYGCALLPVDVHYGPTPLKQALQDIRAVPRENAANTAAVRVLQQSASLDASAVTLTLIGYKGGSLQEQINQDRAIVLCPFHIVRSKTTTSTSATSSSRRTTTTTTKQPPQPSLQSLLEEDRILLGVFDGHAPRGELVSEFTATELPKRLAAKLETALTDCCIDNNTAQDNNNNDDEMAQQQQQQQQLIMDTTIAVLHDTFVELDRTAPAQPTGGCTATVVLQQAGKIYIANAGDSRSFIVSYRPSTGVSEIVYMSREDKPDLPDEMARVQAAGGHVYIPAHGTSRVVYHDPQTGAPTGLAMSRSIGDWEAGKMGVIPDPIVHVLDIQTLVSTQLYGMATTTTTPQQGAAIEMDAQGNVQRVAADDVEDDVYIFAVSATDGMMDYLHEAEIATILSHSLFAEAGIHPVSACEHLVFAAAQGWYEAKQGRYRDDIAIAVSALRRPPPRPEPPAQ